MDDVQTYALIDLTKDNASSSNSIVQYFNLNIRDDRGTNRLPELIDLTVDDDQIITSNTPVIDLIDDNEQFLNCRIPATDLRNDDVQDITNQVQCIDLTYNDASSSNHTIRNFSSGHIDGRATNRSTELIDLTFDDIQAINLNTPVIDSTCDSDQFTNYIINFDRSNDVQDTAHRLKIFDLTNSKQQNRNDCVPTIDLTNHSSQSIDHNIPVTDLTKDKNCNVNRRPSIDLKPNDGKVIEKTVDDVEMSYYSHTNFQRGVIENNLRIPAANFSYNAIEKDSSKSNEALNLNAMQINTSNSIQKFNRRKETANRPLSINYERRKETANLPLSINYERRKETSLENRQLTKNSKDVEKATFTKNSQAMKSEEKYLSPGKSEQTSQSKVSDFLKSSNYPIPLRHSLRRSTVKTSQNVPFECSEASEGDSRIMTASSLIHRKKSKSNSVFSKHNLPNSKKPSTLSGNTFSFEAFKRFFQKFWIFLLLVFIGLYYWI